MDQVACTCDGLPAHSHRATGRTVPGSLIESGSFAGMRRPCIEMDPYDIVMWVDWRAVARAFIFDAPTEQGDEDG